ncbi:DUF2218 domain-containing protein [Kibdelosporangium persicum]|uniref:DUF2218 domain-containing protein n=1 Tax=Kibdelosporangium persicum TaxID=2698649 RepID=UPI001566D6C2|nr:DUF2218 domain-containing protein [Kibdelosporangium persicum]
MLSVEGQVRTDRSSRYLVQLCRHFSNKGRHLPGHGMQRHVLPKEMHVEWSDTQGTVDFGWGRCVLRATPEVLTLQVEACDHEKLDQVRQLLTGHIERFGRRDNLAVAWSAAEPTDATATPHTRAVNRRKRATVIALIAAGALAVTIHLGLAGAVLTSRWTTVAVISVLAVVLLKVIVVSVVVRRRRAARRRTKPGVDVTVPQDQAARKTRQGFGRGW